MASVKRLSLGLIALIAPFAASAYDIGKVMREGTPEATFVSSKRLFVVERCIIEADSPGFTSVYRTPDRPGDSLIIMGSAASGKPQFMQLVETVPGSLKVIIWNGSRWRKAVEDCL